MSEFSGDFKTWLKEAINKSDNGIAELESDPNGEAAVSLKKQFEAFQEWLKCSPKSPVAGNEDKSALFSGDYDINRTYDQFEADFKKWVKQEKNVDLDDLSLPKQPSETELKQFYEEYKDTAFNLKVNDNTRQVQDPPENSDWRQKKVESWKQWCEQEHRPSYIYDEDPSETVALRFDVYKTNEDKEAGKKAATIQYNSPRQVSIETDDGKAPDYEFFDKLAREAKSDNIPGITFSGEMTDDFKARLAAACIDQGLKMKDGPDFIDPNLLGNVSEELKKKVANYNKKVAYQNFYNRAKQSAAQYAQNNPDKPFNLAESFPNRDESTPVKAALFYAACRNSGIDVEGALEFNAETHGMFIIGNDKKHLPEEAQKAINEFNNDACSLVTNQLRDRRGLSEEDKQERDEVLADRQKIRDLRERVTEEGKAEGKTKEEIKAAVEAAVKEANETQNLQTGSRRQRKFDTRGAWETASPAIVQALKKLSNKENE